MTTEKQDSARLVLQTLSTFFLLVLTGINGWALVQIVELDNRVAVNETKIESFTEAGPRYSRYDAEKDLGVVMKLLENQGKTIDDHEGRIRKLEMGE